MPGIKDALAVVIEQPGGNTNSGVPVREIRDASDNHTVRPHARHNVAEQLVGMPHVGEHIRRDHNIVVVSNLRRDAGVNIATFHLGRTAPGQDAIALVEVDQLLTPELIETVRHLPNVIQAKAMRF